MSAHLLIVGGGVAGVTTALRLANAGLRITLVESGDSLVGGPPFCHLHAGGNLYPDIDDAQCRTLLRQSIDFARFYPFVVDKRPTLLAIPKRCELAPERLFDRLVMLQESYAALIEKDVRNGVLGDAEEYFALFDVEAIATMPKESERRPQSPEAWVAAALPYIDLSKIKLPIALVQEYGLNLFRLAAGAVMALRSLENVTLRFGTTLTSLSSSVDGFEATVVSSEGVERIECDYLVNAAGYQTGKIDEMLGIACKKSVEFKAAYVSHWQTAQQRLLPEMIFHGKRGSETGMGQFTPYAGGFVQLHAMTPRATLYEKGLVKTEALRCQPKLGKDFLSKLTGGWQAEEIEARTREAIAHLSHFMPAFRTAIPAAKPLYGAQQIPGEEPSLRVAEAAFPMRRYARCEIVKVSSAIDMAEAIIKELYREGLIERAHFDRCPDALQALDEAELSKTAAQIAAKRGYPKEMSELLCR